MLSGCRKGGVRGSECDAYARVFQAHGEDASVNLVKLHQLQEVNKQSDTVVHGVVLPAALLALDTHTQTE